MKDYSRSLKCNITITLPVDVLNELDNIVETGISRNRIVNEAVLHYLKKMYKISF